MHTANQLAAARTHAGLTQKQLAERLGVDPSTVWRWEARHTGIPDSRKHEIAAVLGISVATLMGWHIPQAIVLAEPAA